MKTGNKNKIRKAAAVLKVIAHPIRLEIISLLTGKPELTVSQICKKTGTDQSVISHHLKNLRLQKVLSARREGQNVFYSIRLKEVIQVISCMDKCRL